MLTSLLRFFPHSTWERWQEDSSCKMYPNRRRWRFHTLLCVQRGIDHQLGSNGWKTCLSCSLNQDWLRKSNLHGQVCTGCWDG
jgi:hypothetical protein